MAKPQQQRTRSRLMPADSVKCDDKVATTKTTKRNIQDHHKKLHTPYYAYNNCYKLKCCWDWMWL